MGDGDFHSLERPIALEFAHRRSYGDLGSPRMIVEFRSHDSDNVYLGRTIVMVTVDSGADVTMLPGRFATPLRVPLESLPQTSIRGAAGVRVPCYAPVDLEARLCGRWVKVPVRFFAGEDRTGGLLGRAGAFESMRLAFVHGESVMYADAL